MFDMIRETVTSMDFMCKKECNLFSKSYRTKCNINLRSCIKLTHVILRIYLVYCNLIIIMIKLLHLLWGIFEICTSRMYIHTYEKMSGVYAVFAN